MCPPYNRRFSGVARQRDRQGRRSRPQTQASRPETRSSHKTAMNGPQLLMAQGCSLPPMTGPPAGRCPVISFNFLQEQMQRVLGMMDQTRKDGKRWPSVEGSVIQTRISSRGARHSAEIDSGSFVRWINLDCASEFGLRLRISSLFMQQNS